MSVNGSMPCPSCGGEGSIEFTYKPPTLHEVQRRRKCVSCRRRWRTVEYYAGNDPDVPAIVRDIDVLLAIMIEQMQAIRDRVIVGAYSTEDVDNDKKEQ